MKTENGHILTFSDKMQICAVSCFVTCDWFCPMTSHMDFRSQRVAYTEVHMANNSL